MARLSAPVGVLSLLCTLLLAGCGSPPQVTASDEAMESVDALWTALTSKRSDLLEQTAKSLERLHANKQLSDAALQSLQAIIGDARSGDWEEATTTLKWFIRGQRRASGKS